MSLTSSLLAGTEIGVSMASFVVILLVSLAFGLFISVSYIYKSKTRYTKSFVVTLALIPAVVSAIIIMVNGNVGTGVAVAGAFSLVRFRSVPGTAKEIGSIFIAMCVGLTMGMGYIFYAAVFVIIVCLASYFITASALGDIEENKRQLTVTVPESLDYVGMFDDLMEKYAENYVLLKVRSVNMGSLFKLTYELDMKDCSKEKEFLDEVRCRNGNLEVMLAMQLHNGTDL